MSVCISGALSVFCQLSKSAILALPHSSKGLLVGYEGFHGLDTPMPERVMPQKQCVMHGGLLVV